MGNPPPPLTEISIHCRTCYNFTCLIYNDAVYVTGAVSQTQGQGEINKHSNYLFRNE